MIKPEDLRTGDLVRVSRDCAFPKGTMCVVSDINPLKVFKDKKGVVSLSAINDDDDGPWAFGAAMSKAYPLHPKYSTKMILRKKPLVNTIQSLLITRSILLRDIWR